MATKKTGKRKQATTPWERPAPRKTRHTKLTAADKSEAKQRAKKAGRSYPNLVDNMTVAKEKKGGRKKKSAAKRKSGRKASKRRATGSHQRRSALKDPRGGLTAAGRNMFERKQGSHLRAGVRKSDRDMTLEEMRRKGSWAARFYGRKKLPPLIDAKGEPTRFALSANAWGEPVPKTIAAARRIAAKGQRLLDRYQRLR